MQRLLNPSEAARIRERLHDNGLLQTCQRVWPDRQAIITSFAACAEDIFCEVVWLVDELIETDRDSDAISLTKGLWTTVTNHISSWAGQVSLTDRYLAVSTVFRIVATAFSLHWESYYSDRLREALLDVENEKMPAPKDLYDLRQGQRQQEELLMSIASCSELLSEWVNEYIDNPNLWLTEEIDMALNPQPNIKPPKPESRKADKKTNSDYSRYSFLLNVSKRKLENLYLMLSQRDNEGKSFIDSDLQRFNKTSECLPLSQGEIRNYKPVEIDKMLFNQVFSGQETYVRIVWKGDAVELWYLINTLYNYKVNGRRLLEKSGAGPGIWQIVCNRFMNGKPRKVLDERTGKEVETSDPIEYEEKDFRHYSKKNSPKDTSTLDAIIGKIAPPRDKTDKEVIAEDLNPENYGIKAPTSAEQLEGDFRDTSHHSKNQ